MPVDLSIVESTTELGQTVVEVVLESASEPGPAGPGVPTGGTVGQVLTKQSGTDFDTDWEDAGGAGSFAPIDADYLVGTANGTLSGEIVVGTAPGGELGGTWASPTVDATHSGSSHAAVQAAAEATAAAALSSHETDTTNVHGIADTTAVMLEGDAAGGVLGGTYPNPSFAADMATQAELDAHVNDSSAAHAASAISADSTTLVGTGTDVQAVLEELDNGIADHLADAADAHAGTAITNTPAGTIAATTVQAAINELDSEKTTAAAALSAAQTEIADQRRIMEVVVGMPGDLVGVGDGVAYARIPHTLNGHNLVRADAAVHTASASGGPLLIQVHNLTQAADMLSTRINIDDGEKKSTDASTQPVVDTNNDDVATLDEIRVDVDDAGDGAADGLIVVLYFEAP